jgi:hypothetical protein
MYKPSPKWRQLTFFSSNRNIADLSYLRRKEQQILSTFTSYVGLRTQRLLLVSGAPGDDDHPVWCSVGFSPQSSARTIPPMVIDGGITADSCNVVLHLHVQPTATMLLQRNKHWTFDRAIKNPDLSIVLLPVSVAGNTDMENMERMDVVAWASRESGCGTVGVQGCWAGSADPIFLVLSRGGEGHVVGLGRKVLGDYVLD